MTSCVKTTLSRVQLITIFLQLSVLCGVVCQAKDLRLSITISANQTIVNGTQATINCSAPSIHRDAIIYISPGDWQQALEFKPLQNSSKYILNNQRHFTSLRIRSFSHAEEGTYFCYSVAFEAVHISTVTTLRVAAPPIISPMATVRVNISQTLRLECSSSGLPKPHLEIRFNSQVLVSADSSLRVAVNLPNASIANTAGQYSCYASNIAGNDTKRLSVIVQGPPLMLNFTAKKVFVPSSIGGFSLTCEVRSALKASITWDHNTSLVQNDTNRIVLIRNDISHDHRIMSKLTVSPQKKATVGLADGGAYTCRVMNALGKTSHTTTVIVQVPPSSPGKPFVIADLTEQRTIVVRWQQPAFDGHARLSYRILVSSEVRIRLPELDQNVSAGKSLQASVSGLSVNTPYFFQVQALNVVGAGGKSAYSDLSRTLPESPPPPTMLWIAEEAPTSLLLKWKAPAFFQPSQDRLVSFAIHYYKLVPGTSSPEVAREIRGIPPTKREQRITGLERKTRYRFHIVTHNRALASDPDKSPSVTGITTASVPSVPVWFDPILFNSTTVLLRWHAVKDDGDSALQYFQLKRASNGDVGRIIKVPADRVSYTAGGVKPLSRYTFYLTAVNSEGESQSANLTVTIPPVDAPPQPSLLIILRTSQSLFVRASTDIKATVHFVFRYRLSSSLGLWKEIDVQGLSGACLNDLMPNSSYDVQVAAYRANSRSRSLFSERVQATTLDDEFVPQPEVHVLDVHTVSVEWPSCGPKPQLFRVQYRQQGSSRDAWQTVLSSSGQVIISGLLNNTQYEFRLLVSLSPNISRESSLVIINTFSAYAAPTTASVGKTPQSLSTTLVIALASSLGAAITVIIVVAFRWKRRRFMQNLAVIMNTDTGTLSSQRRSSSIRPLRQVTMVSTARLSVTAADSGQPRSQTGEKKPVERNNHLVNHQEKSEFTKPSYTSTKNATDESHASPVHVLSHLQLRELPKTTDI